MNKFFKKIVAVATTMALVLACSACSSAPSGNEGTTFTNGDSTGANNVVNKKNTEITFWFANSGTVEDYVADAVSRFNNSVGAEKGITVTAEYQGAYADLHQKLQAAFISGTAPDVVTIEIAAVGMFAEGGMLENLNGYVDKEDIGMSDFYDGLLYNCNIDGSYYALPFLRSTSILYMNRTMLQNAGVDVDNLKTWDDYKKASELVKEKTGKVGFSIPLNYWYWEAFMLSNGSKFISDDEKSVIIDNEVARRVLNYFKDLMDKDAAHIYSYTEAENMSADIMNQDAAFWFGSTGSLTQMLNISKELGFELDTAFIPYGTQNGVTVGGCNIAMLSGLSADKQQAVWEFIKFMTNSEETVNASRATGYLVTRKSAVDNPKMVELYTEYPQYKVALDQLEVASGRPNNAGYNEFQANLTYALSDMLCSGANWDETLAKLQAEGDALLNE